MLTYEEMEYLAAFAACGTLSEVAARFHISQPTITRCMKHIEAELDVPLFERTKNRIRLNSTGQFAAAEAALWLKQTNEAVQRIKAFDRANRTISVGSCAAVQLPSLVQRISALYPASPMSTMLEKPAALLAGLREGLYQLVVLPGIPEGDDLVGVKIAEESLMFLLPKQHKFARRKSLSMAEMDGESLLLFSRIGFWRDMVQEKMPHAKFVVQDERASFEALITHSVLPCFTTNLVQEGRAAELGRVIVPISDSACHVTYYLVCKREMRARFAPLFVN